MKTHIAIRNFNRTNDSAAVAELWRNVFGYGAPHNEPTLVIEMKANEDDGLFFVAEIGGKIIGTVMAGYDGHRGWIYSLAVAPDQRRQGLGRALIVHAEQALTGRGCLKVNLQIMQDNHEVTAFYQKLGYAVEPRVSMGKLLKK